MNALNSQKLALACPWRQAAAARSGQGRALGDLRTDPSLGRPLSAAGFHGVRGRTVEGFLPGPSAQITLRAM
jgi:hypothetical protein